MDSILEKVKKLTDTGTSVKEACDKLKIPVWKYYGSMPKKTKKIKVTEIPIRSARVFAFYGSPDEIASILRTLQ